MIQMILIPNYSDRHHLRYRKVLQQVSVPAVVVSDSGFVPRHNPDQQLLGQLLPAQVASLDSVVDHLWKSLHCWFHSLLILVSED